MNTPARAVLSNPSPATPTDIVEVFTARWPDPRERGRMFERVMCKALKEHPGEYGTHRFAEVWLWADWPDRRMHGYQGDVGIDLVAREHDGGLCAIQTKLYTKAKIGKKDVDSFLSASGASHFTSRILVTVT